MVALRHAVLHAQEQQIVWQQIFIGPREYILAADEVKLPPTQKTNSPERKN